jgi:Holliday junction resolvase RusA-like endonuclease
LDFIFVLRGKPTSQKNLKRAGIRNGKSFIYTPPEVQRWKTSAVHQLKEQWHYAGAIPSKIELEAEVHSYLGKGQSIDADNLLGGPLDSLQRAGILENDYWIKKVTSLRLKDKEEPRVIIWLKNYRPPGP